MNTHIALAHEELLYLMQLLSIPILPGFAGSPLVETNQEDFIRVMGVAERCLRAKGFLDIEQNTLVVDNAVAGILSYCAHNPGALLAVRSPLTNLSQSMETSETVVLHGYDSRLHVKHQQSFGVHHFTVYSSLDQLGADVMAWMAGGMIVSSVPESTAEFDVTGALLLVLRATVSAQQVTDEQIGQMLVTAGYQGDAAIEIVHFLRHDVEAITTFGRLQVPAALLDNPVSQQESDVFACMSTPAGWWILLAGQPTADRRDQLYHVQPCTAELVRAQIMAQFS